MRVRESHQLSASSRPGARPLPSDLTLTLPGDRSATKPKFQLLFQYQVCVKIRGCASPMGGNVALHHRRYSRVMLHKSEIIRLFPRGQFSYPDWVNHYTVSR